jgi:hypothetical protein
MILNAILRRSTARAVLIRAALVQSDPRFPRALAGAEFWLPLSQASNLTASEHAHGRIQVADWLIEKLAARVA